jgi:hypothetical protein
LKNINDRRSDCNCFTVKLPAFFAVRWRKSDNCFFRLFENLIHMFDNLICLLQIETNLIMMKENENGGYDNV